MKKNAFKVIVGAGYFSLSGVHVFAIHLVRGLCERGYDAQLFLTEQNTELVSLPPNPMKIPADLPVRELPVARKGNWAAHWETTVHYVEAHAPCIYLPNVDYRHSCVSPKLSRNVSVIGVIQGDDPIHYEHVTRLGKYWDAIVGVSAECSAKAGACDPTYPPRVSTIPNGAPVPEICPPRNAVEGAPLHFIYHGVLNTYQKRIFDVAEILHELDRRKVPFKFTIAGAGPEQAELLAKCDPYLKDGRMRFLGLVPNDQISKLLSENDAYILTSRFEGLPHAVVEAMAVGCVPVVTDVSSGIPELVETGVTGFRIPIGNTKEFADRLEFLQKNAGKRVEMAKKAHHRVLHSPFNVERMVDSYEALFDKVWKARATGEYKRPYNKVLPPPATVDGLSIFPVDHAAFVEQVEKRIPPRVG